MDHNTIFPRSQNQTVVHMGMEVITVPSHRTSTSLSKFTCPKEVNPNSQRMEVLKLRSAEFLVI